MAVGRNHTTKTRKPRFAARLGGAMLAMLGPAMATAQALPAPVLAPNAPNPADIVVQRIEYLDCAPRAGVTIYNQGASAVTAPFEVRLTTTWTNGRTRELTQRIGGLGGFSSARLIFELAPGDVYAAFADVRNVVKEANEANNELRVAARSLVRCPTVSVGSAAAAEGQPIRIPVSISHAFSQAVTVTFTTEDGTATGAPFGLVDGTGTTACGADYIRAQNGTIEFPAGTSQLTQLISISTCVDNAAESAETFALRITKVANGVVTLDTAVGTATIQDAAP